MSLRFFTTVFMILWAYSPTQAEPLGEFLDDYSYGQHFKVEENGATIKFDDSGTCYYLSSETNYYNGLSDGQILRSSSGETGYWITGDPLMSFDLFDESFSPVLWCLEFSSWSNQRCFFVSYEYSGGKEIIRYFDDVNDQVAAYTAYKYDGDQLDSCSQL